MAAGQGQWQRSPSHTHVGIHAHATHVAAALDRVPTHPSLGTLFAALSQQRKLMLTVNSGIVPRIDLRAAVARAVSMSSNGVV